MSDETKRSPSPGAPGENDRGLMQLKCQCCGIEASLTEEEAFEAGWDAPPYFTQVVCCPLCPAVAAMGLIDHTEAHARWAREGRPETFGEQFAHGDLPPL